VQGRLRLFHGDQFAGGVLGGIGAGRASERVLRLLSLNFRELCVGHAQASPNARFVRPAILWPRFERFRISRNAAASSIRSVIFFIQSEPSRHGVHCRSSHVHKNSLMLFSTHTMSRESSITITRGARHRSTALSESKSIGISLIVSSRSRTNRQLFSLA